VFDLILVYFAGHKMSNLDPKAKPAENRWCSDLTKTALQFKTFQTYSNNDQDTTHTLRL